MGISLEQSEVASTIRLEGAIDIASASQLKALLLRALEAGRLVRVPLEGATDLDVTAVQLLCAASHEAKTRGVRFEFDGQPLEQVSAALAHAGLEQFVAHVEAS